MGHDHHEITPNPEYDGPGQHCLPPAVRNTILAAICFGLLMVLVVWGGAKMGGLL